MARELDRFLQRDDAESTDRPDSLEHQVIKKLTAALPEWTVVEESAAFDRGFDLVATSPTGQIFPIDVKPGRGKLDVSSIAQFGSSVERTLIEPLAHQQPKIANESREDFTRRLTEYAHIPIEEDATAQLAEFIDVKPIILTSREPSAVVEDYAESFRTAIVSTEVDPETSRVNMPPDPSRLTDHLVTSLVKWNNKINSLETLNEDSEPIEGTWYHIAIGEHPSQT